MLLSVIIVNYRVPYFLDLCLRSVKAAIRGMDAEIIVVDNHSADGSVAVLRPLFPGVKWIESDGNLGFARANNIGLAQASGEFILFLNPDTVVPEDFAHRCLGFFQSTGDIGALGVRMIDGAGQFLKESRRGFPTPWVAFCRLSGLTALFPRSRVFARYYLGHLPVDRTCAAPVLSGAFLFVSRKVLSRVGPFDESFFLYGEDIDLSYRLGKEGENYYFPEVTIIHFKGESTQKDIRYTRQFYKAMIQFRRKHFHRGLPGAFLLDPAIWVRGALSAIGKRITRTRRPGKPRRTALVGDPAAMRHLRERMGPERMDGEIITTDPNTADHLIYCIGETFTFKSAIEALEKKNPAQTAAFYADGGLAVVGSARSDTRGEIRIL